MSAANSACRRRLAWTPIACGREPQTIPWWQSTSWAPAAAALLEQLEMGRDARHDELDLLGARDLKPVRAVVGKAG